MKPTKNIRNIFILTVSYLYIILFVYASVSKILDFENFNVQIGQSPLLSAFAGFVSWAVLIIELGVSFLLATARFRQVGLLAAFALMTMFTVYIFIMLNYSAFVPCSCGGILEKMGWTEHLVFNIFFLGLATIAGILGKGRLPENPGNHTIVKRTSVFLVVGVLSAATVSLLFIRSEYLMQHENNFVRRFPKHPLEKYAELNLTYNSYYFAGMDSATIYLGNVTAPLHVAVVDSKLRSNKYAVISLQDSKMKFRALKLHVSDSLFFLSDGFVPAILKGHTRDWNGSLWFWEKTFFFHAVPAGDETVAIRSLSSGGSGNVLGLVKENDSVRFSDKLLQKQIDGLFDTDGVLCYNKELQKIIYLHYYRNEFTVINRDLSLSYRGHTIDTVTKANIKVAHLKKENKTTLAEPPLLVNKDAVTYGRYLFVHAGLRGRFESAKMWDKAAVIDVYDLVNDLYVFSFYIPHTNRGRMKAFRVYGNNVAVLTENYLTTYTLSAPEYKPERH